MTTTLLDTTATQVRYEFTMNDRCDADPGARRTDGRGVSVAEQAYHRFFKDEREIFLCDHHQKLHVEALISDGWAVESDLAAIEAMSIRHKIYVEVDGE